jgi:hypothetical protein
MTGVKEWTAEAEAWLAKQRDALGDPTRLDPDHLLPVLRPYYTSGEEDGLFPMLRHPLVFQVPFHSWKLANESYRFKQKAVDEALAARKFTTALIYAEKPYRIMLLHGYWQEHDMTDDELREELSWVWPDSENAWQQMDEALEMFNWCGYTADDTEGRRMPTPLVCYRGAEEHNQRGMSWTRSIGRAEWFARRFESEPGAGKVYRTVVEEPALLGHFMGRGEQEIVVEPELLGEITVLLEGFSEQEG